MTPIEIGLCVFSIGMNLVAVATFYMLQKRVDWLHDRVQRLQLAECERSRRQLNSLLGVASD